MSTYRLGTQLPQIHQCVPKIPRVLNLDPQVILMSLILLHQITHMLKVPRLSTHPNGRIQIERQFTICVIFCGFPTRFRLDEAVKMSDVFEFRVGIQ
jgi:hypothetical protein